MTNNKITKIKSAPHWRTLKPYGGHLHIHHFRTGLSRVEYKCHENTQNPPMFCPQAKLYEEKIKF